MRKNGILFPCLLLVFCFYATGVYAQSSGCDQRFTGYWGGWPEGILRLNPDGTGTLAGTNILYGLSPNSILIFNPNNRPAIKEHAWYFSPDSNSLLLRNVADGSVTFLHRLLFMTDELYSGYSELPADEPGSDITELSEEETVLDELSEEETDTENAELSEEEPDSENEELSEDGEDSENGE